MESSLHHVWESAVGNPFVPTIGKDSQFTVGISLLIAGILLSGLFGLSMWIFRHLVTCSDLNTDRSLLTIPLLGVPASLALALVHPYVQNTQGLIFSRFGAVYMICAVGVYV
jgi:hypothetical protein